MSYWKLFYHFVWTTKCRMPWITAEVARQLYPVIVAKAVALGGLVHAVGGTEDHVHLVVSVPPKVALARFIGEVKGSSSHFANHELRLDGHVSWQEEYGVVSLREQDLPKVVRYVRDQQRHHAQSDTIARLECAEITRQ